MRWPRGDQGGRGGAGNKDRPPEALAKAVLADLPTATLRERLQRRVRDVSLDDMTVTTTTRRERNHPAGGETVIKVWLECEVSHRPGVVGAAEIADACRDELEHAVKIRVM